MSHLHILASSEQLLDRPFTSPALTTQDSTAMQQALALLRTELSKAEQQPLQAAAPQTFWLETEGRTHRLIVNNVQALLALPHLIMVGFFGQRRHDADPAAVMDIDQALVDELREHAGIIAYCTCELPDGDYGNLVLFSYPEAKEHWLVSDRHAKAVRTLAPKYYYSVRLHNGFIPGGLLGEGVPVIERTKYYDYRGMLPWRGIREMMTA